VDTGFNAQVTLSCPPVPLDKGLVPLTNGVWSGQLTIQNGEGGNLVISAEGGGLSGQSNSFSTSGAATATGSLYGMVTSDAATNAVPIAGATVHLSLTPNGPDVPQGPQTTDSNGQFSFPGVAAGNYYLWATYQGASSSTSRRVPVSGPTARNIAIPTAGSPDQLPVILVAGNPGSTDELFYKSCPIPRLPKPDYDNRDRLRLHDARGLDCHWVAGWDYLKDILQQKKVTVVDCPWDWRKPIDQAMKRYLKDAINEARRVDPTDPHSPISPTKKVNIIAHSMGGLLARAYIQGGDYQKDVENLIIVGTPHEGSANAYCLWEGGDPWAADNLVTAWNPHFYTLTMTYLLEDSSCPWLNCLDVKGFIHDHVPSIKQLLPTYAFLDFGNGPNPITSSKDNINQDLKDLNNGTNAYVKPDERMGPPDNTEGKVRTRVYYSGSENTVGNIHVRNTTRLGLYTDGEPNGPVSYVLGDGTVNANSATLPIQERWADGQVVVSEHGSLIKNAKDFIAGYLYPTPTSSSPTKSAATAPLSSTFSITFNGWLQPYLADSQGRALGFNLTNGDLVKTIPQTSLATEPDCGSLGVDNPADGNYTLSLKGQFPGAYRVPLNYLDSAKAVTQDLAGFNNANTTTITILVDSTNPAKIIINPQVPAPTSVTASNVQGKTQLTWQASAGAVSYQIYALLPGSSDYVLIGTTADTNFLTNDPWLTDNSATPTVYVIVAVKADGATSFFSNTAANKPITPVKKATMTPIISLLLSD
jgi:pimeloyl-ACP methyl ester carboxylesterase